MREDRHLERWRSSRYSGLADMPICLKPEVLGALGGKPQVGAEDLVMDVRGRDTGVDGL